MSRLLRTARRTLRAALHAGRHVVAAAISAHHRLLVRLLTAIDAGATLRIRYTDRHGVVSVRDISPRDLRATNTGDITVRAYDWRDGDEATFRTDRITLNTEENPMATPTHPLVAHIPPADLRGAITQAIPAGEGVVTVAGTDATWGVCEVTAWRPVPQWELDMLAAEFPGECQPRAVSVTSRILQDGEPIDAAITEATEFLGAYLARVDA